MTITDQKLIETSSLEATLRVFAAERNWEQFHSPKNLAMALTGEVGELVELFQWLTEEQSRKIMESEKSATAVKDEIADVLIYSIRLASVLGIDINTAIKEKIVKNGQKYPASL